MKKFFAGAAAVLTITALPCQAENDAPFLPTLNSVRIFAPNGAWGHGVRLDGQRIITAAHVVDGNADGAEFKVLDLHEREIGAAAVIKHGHRDDVDLALLALTEEVSVVRTAVLCEENAAPGEELEVIFGANQHRTHASFDFATMWQGHTYSTATEAFYSRGVSGAGVYSETRRCLVGIVSKQESWGENPSKCFTDFVAAKPSNKACAMSFGTNFVSAKDIRHFVR